MQPEQAQIPAVRSAGSVRLYCVVLVAAPLLAFCGAIVLARTHWFIERAVPPYLRMIDTEAGIRNRRCDVLIFGDSTALTGFMPWTIQQDTGMSTCNIAQTKGSVGVSGLTFLRAYLSSNPAPRVLVLAFSPEDWRPDPQWSEVAYVEGVLQMVRHQPLRVYAAALLRHPNEAFGFATFVYKSALQSLATRGRSAQWPAGENGGEVREGHMTLPAAPETACLAQDRQSPRASVTPMPDYATSLRREFAPRAGTVLLLVPNIPDCDPLLGFFATRLDPVLDQPIATQPIGDYNDVDRHFTRAGAEKFSHEISALIRTRPAVAP